MLSLPAPASELRRIFERDVGDVLLARSLTPEGLFQSDPPAGSPAGAPPYALLVAQGRGIFALVLAYETLGKPEYREAAAAASELLLDKGWDPANGGFFWGFDAAGRVPPDTPFDRHSDKRTLGQAIAALALAATSRATGDARYWTGARATLELIEEQLAGPKGSYLFDRQADYSPRSSGTDLDTLIHVFETLLGLRGYAPPSEREPFDAPLMALADFLLERRSIVPGSGGSRSYVPGHFDAAGRPLLAATSDLKGVNNYGHNAELAFLLSRAVEEGLPNAWLEPAETLLRYAVEEALRPDGQGGAMAFESEVQRKAFDTGRAPLAMWPALEICRATLHWSVVRGQTEWAEDGRRVWRTAQRLFLDSERGGWRESAEVDSTQLNPWYGAPYHSAMFLHEALRLAEQAPRSRPRDP